MYRSDFNSFQLYSLLICSTLLLSAIFRTNYFKSISYILFLSIRFHSISYSIVFLFRSCPFIIYFCSVPYKAHIPVLLNAYYLCSFPVSFLLDSCSVRISFRFRSCFIPILFHSYCIFFLRVLFYIFLFYFVPLISVPFNTFSSYLFDSIFIRFLFRISSVPIP